MKGIIEGSHQSQLYVCLLELIFGGGFKVPGDDLPGKMWSSQTSRRQVAPPVSREGSAAPSGRWLASLTRCIYRRGTREDSRARPTREATSDTEPMTGVLHSKGRGRLTSRTRWTYACEIVSHGGQAALCSSHCCSLG